MFEIAASMTAQHFFPSLLDFGRGGYNGPSDDSEDEDQPPWSYSSLQSQSKPSSNTGQITEQR